MSELTLLSQKDLFKFTVQIAAAYVSNHKTDIKDFSEIMSVILYGLDKASEKLFLSGTLNPAVPISETITDEYLVCLEDGKKLMMLKRHLRTVYGLSMADYKKRWNLPANYPAVAPNYSKRRSQIAKESGLGLTHTRRSRRDVA